MEGHPRSSEKAPLGPRKIKNDHFDYLELIKMVLTKINRLQDIHVLGTSLHGTIPAGRFFSLNGELAIAANRQSKI